MAYQISSEDMERYRAGARERQRRREERDAQRRVRAFDVAHVGARLLKDEFSAQRVVMTAADTVLSSRIRAELHTFYTKTEQLFELIARNVDESLPRRATWHHDLLQQMVAEVRDRRPPVIRRSTRDCAEEYLSFRHAVRNVYVLKLDTSRVRELVARARACYQSLSTDLQAFCGFLESLD